MKGRADDRKRSPTKRRLWGPVDHNQNRLDADQLWTNLNETSRTRVDFNPNFRPSVVTTADTEDAFADAELAGYTEAGIAGIGSSDGDVEAEHLDEACVRLPCDVMCLPTGADGTPASEAILPMNSDDTAPCEIQREETASQSQVTIRDVIGIADDDSSSVPCGYGGKSPSPPAALHRSTPLSNQHTKEEISHSFSSPSIGENTKPGSPVRSLVNLRCSRRSPSTWRALVRVPDEKQMPPPRSSGESVTTISDSHNPTDDQQQWSRNSTAEPSSSSSSSSLPREESTYRNEGRRVPVLQLQGDEAMPPQISAEGCFFKPIGVAEESSPPTRTQSPDEGGDQGCQVTWLEGAEGHSSGGEEARGGYDPQFLHLGRRRKERDGDDDDDDGDDKEDGEALHREKLASRKGSELFSQTTSGGTFFSRRLREKLKEIVTKPPDPKRSKASDDKEEKEDDEEDDDEKDKTSS